MSWLLLAAVVSGAGCSVVLDTQECDGDADCEAERPTCVRGLCRLADDGAAPAGEGEGEGEGEGAKEPNQGDDDDDGDEGAAGEGEGAPETGEGEGEGEPRAPVDRDGDGFVAADDCDDDDDSVHPGALDLCGDGADRDCSGVDDTPCKVLDLEAPFWRGTAIDVVGEQLLVGLSPNKADLGSRFYVYVEGVLFKTLGLPSTGGVDHVDGVWLSDSLNNRVWKQEIEDAQVPDEFRLDGGRPLAPTGTVVIDGGDAADLLLVAGLHGELAWSRTDGPAASRALAGVDNPAFVATDGTAGQALVASVSQRRLHVVGLDDFHEPLSQQRIDLPSAPRAFAASPRRAWVLVAGDVVRVNLDSAEVRPLGLELDDDVGRLAVDGEQALAYVAGGGGLDVVDLAAATRLRTVALPEGEVTDMVVHAGRALVLVATQPDDEGRATSVVVTVGPAL